MSNILLALFPPSFVRQNSLLLTFLSLRLLHNRHTFHRRHPADSPVVCLSPQGALFDVVADPGESRDLRADRPELAAELADVLAQWRRRQLAYYHYPQYYGRYAPPRPPKL